MVERIKQLELNFGQNWHEAFEDMVTHMFCTYLGLRHAPLRRKNMAGIEAEPVRCDDGKVYAYQAKSYEDSTELSSKKGEFIKAIDEARSKGATDLILFVNKTLTQDPKTKEPPSWAQEVAASASGKNGKPKVNLHWWDLGVIQTTLDMPAYHYIRDMFLGGSHGDLRRVNYYKDTCGLFLGDKGSRLYGNVPLSKCYVEPSTDRRRGDGSFQSVRACLESWVSDGERIAVICGEPGHGKTSLCRKAVCDFHRDSWLTTRVSNVFCFSLNPTGTGALDGGRFNFYALLSWGQDRRDNDHRLMAEDCQNALVFLDGFDELVEQHPIGLRDFVIDYVNPFVRATAAHVVITTRSTIVESGTTHYNIGFSVPIVRLQPFAQAQQLELLDKFCEHIRTKMCDNTASSTPDRRDELKNELYELVDYYKMFNQTGASEDIQVIFGIPIVFRMAVAARYVPQAGESITLTYNNLFDVTWKRYEGLGVSLSTTEEKRLKEAKDKLSRHALRVYANNADTAVVRRVIKSPWVFKFYTTHTKDGGKSRIGFLHRSIYHFFLAREIMCWFERYAEDGNEEVLKDRLSYLARRRLDQTTFDYVRAIYDDTKSDNDDKEDGLEGAFARVCKILKETDGILPLPKDKSDAKSIAVVAPLERANNVFWNVVSLCSTCGHRIPAKSLSKHALRLYDLTKCDLRNVDLQKAHLVGTNLAGAVLIWAHLKGADLRRADLRGADLGGADLEGAVLRGADLRGADLEGAVLRRAYLGGAYLGGAVLRGADLEGADLEGAVLRRANLRQANLRQAHLGGAHLGGADLRQANLGGADLGGADLEGADLRQANLRQANLHQANLGGADLRGADLRGANLRGTLLDNQ